MELNYSELQPENVDSILNFLAKFKHTTALDIFFKDQMFSLMKPMNFMPLVNFKDLQELVLFETTCFDQVLKDLEWVIISSLRVLKYSIFYITS